MQIEPYSERYREAVPALILEIQNREAKLHLSLAEQPDLLDIARAYRSGGGEFWVATDDGQLVGTIGLLVKENGCGVLKKFFVRQSCRGQGVGSALYRELLAYARRSGIRHLILDSP